MSRFLGRLVLGAALLAPIAVQAADRDDHRYYDRDHRDYHEWNEGENRAYRHYLEERHEQSDREFNRESRERQRQYWRWRHDHPDTLIFPR